MEYRKISKEEISVLEKQNCRADNWSLIEVSDSFDTRNIHQVIFMGTCRLGNFNCRIASVDSGEVNCGLNNTLITNCILEDKVLISNVAKLANYHVESDVIIENSGALSVSGETHFGNGLEVAVLNEGGGRELPIFDRLSSQLAYLIVTHRHDQQLIQILKESISNYTGTWKSTMGRIKKGSRISNSNTIQNVWIGNDVTIDGIRLLKEGTISGEEGIRTFVGSGVIAKGFIIQSGSSVDSGALLEKTFVGQGVMIGRQFSAENSVFFANSEGFHTEAVSVFAGPYTVTHHKSTLLIAGMFSFFNAGSGTNQSNHMYKLGPLHQGIVERGSKTGSFSYLLWPSKVGPFSVVMGKHGGNFDVSDLPFSYLTVENDTSFLTPAMNLITVGTRRDSTKWPNRDRRKGKRKLDLIHFELFSPFLVGKVLKGIDILSELYANTPKEQETVGYNGVRIKRLMLKSCRKYYEMALHIFLGDQVIRKLEILEGPITLESIKKLIQSKNNTEISDWVDMAGLVTSVFSLEELLAGIKKGGTPELSEIETGFGRLFERYNSGTWEFALKILSERFSISHETVTLKNIEELITRWKDNSIRMNNLIMLDTKKEFDNNSRIGFGLGGDQSVRDADFEQVRGSYDDNSFAKGLLEENSAIDRKASTLIGRLEAR